MSGEFDKRFRTSTRAALLSCCLQLTADCCDCGYADMAQTMLVSQNSSRAILAMKVHAVQTVSALRNPTAG